MNNGQGRGNPPGRASSADGRAGASSAVRPLNRHAAMAGCASAAKAAGGAGLPQYPVRSGAFAS